MQTDIVLSKHRGRLEQAARRFADADKSDPFTLNRVMSHIKNGLASFTKDGDLVSYDAEPFEETRLTATGQEYKVTRFKDIKRI